MTPQQSDVPPVRLVEEVEEIAGQGNRADGGIDDDVRQHAQHQARRRAERTRLHDDDEAEQGPSAVTDPRHQPEQPVETDTKAGARNADLRIEQGGEPLKLFELLPRAVAFHFHAAPDTTPPAGHPAVGTSPER